MDVVRMRVGMSQRLVTVPVRVGHLGQLCRRVLVLVVLVVFVMRSGFLPRALGVLLLAGAAGAMIGAVTSVLPTLSIGAVDKVGQVLALRELPIIVWLVFPGAREPRAAPQTWRRSTRRAPSMAEG